MYRTTEKSTKYAIRSLNNGDFSREMAFFWACFTGVYYSAPPYYYSLNILNIQYNILVLIIFYWILRLLRDYWESIDRVLRSGLIPPCPYTTTSDAVRSRYTCQISNRKHTRTLRFLRMCSEENTVQCAINLNQGTDIVSFSCVAASNDTWRMEINCAFPGPTTTRSCSFQIVNDM